MWRHAVALVSRCPHKRTTLLPVSRFTRKGRQLAAFARAASSETGAAGGGGGSDEQLGETTVSEGQFHRIADATLDLLWERLETLEDDFDDLDMELTDGVLKMDFGAHEHGSWVLNKQGPNRQIWWSSPMSGPKRFFFDEGAAGATEADGALDGLISTERTGAIAQGWLNTRDSQPMTELLEFEMQSLSPGFRIV